MSSRRPKPDLVRLSVIASDLMQECQAAMAEHGPMHSAHEGYAVVLEEVEELWDEVKKKKQHPDLMRKEAIQAGAMCMRFLYDVLGAGIVDVQ